MQKTKVFTVSGLIALLVAIVIQLAWIPTAYAAPPSGSYTETCVGSYTRGDTLFSTCANRKGDYGDTSLKKYNVCRGDISNYQGGLRCDFAMIPAGSYSLSCIDIFEDEGTNLLALCKRARGFPVVGSRFARLNNYKECREGSIDNIDGILICDRPSS